MKMKNRLSWKKMMGRSRQLYLKYRGIHFADRAASPGITRGAACQSEEDGKVLGKEGSRCPRPQGQGVS